MLLHDSIEKVEYDEKKLKEYEKNDFLHYLKVISFNLVKNIEFRNLYFKNNTHLEIIQRISQTITRRSCRLAKNELLFEIDSIDSSEALDTVTNAKPFHDKFVQYMRSLRFILSYVDDVNHYKPMLLKFLEADLENECKTEVLKLIYSRVGEFDLNFEFFYQMLLNLERIDNSMFSSYRTSNVHVYCIKIMICLLNESTSVDFGRLMAVAEYFTAHMNVELLKLYSKWYFTQKIPKRKSEQLVCYQDVRNRNYNCLTVLSNSDKRTITEHEIQLLTLVRKCIAIEKKYAFHVLTQLSIGNPDVQNYVSRCKLLKMVSFDLKPHSLFCAYELSTFSTRNRELFQKNLSKSVVKLILHKIEHFIFDNELLGAFKLFKLFSQKIKFLQTETQNCPILEVCLLSLERDHKSEDINREVLCILSNILLNYNNYRKIFIDNDGFKIVKKKLFMYDGEVLSLCRNFLYSSTFQEKEAFVREIPAEYVNAMFKRQNLDNLNKAFNILRNLFCCNENELVKLLKYFEIQDFPSKMVYILMQYYDFFVNGGSLYKETILNIIYTLVNLCILPNKEKYCILDLDFGEAIGMNDRDINLALIWLFINITWNVTEEEMAKKVRERNVVMWMDMIEGTDEVLCEKKGTLLDNLAKLKSFK